MPAVQASRSTIGHRVIARLDRRAWPILTSIVFVALGCAYEFRWAPVVEHHPYLWTVPLDLWHTYLAASQLGHGQVGAVYKAGLGGFLSFPGILVVLAPLGALVRQFGTTLVVDVSHGHRLVHPGLASYKPAALASLPPQIVTANGQHFTVQPQWAAIVFPFAMVLTCVALFAFDALAERLGVARGRRALLGLGEAVLLWDVTMQFGHPEDALALALAVYALVWTLHGRLAGAGWLFGAAVAFQPLVLLMLPVLLVTVGWSRAVPMTARSILPAAVLVALPLATGFHTTTQALLKQPNFPNVDHATPWTALAPRVTGHGKSLAVASGPGRVVALALAVGLGGWARRLRARPELVVWACAVALALRSYTESVMDGYYLWPALALAVILVSGATAWRFALALGIAVVITVVGVWNIAWLPWWLVEVGGLSVVLLLALGTEPPPAPEPAVELGHLGVWLTQLLAPETLRRSANGQRRPGTKAATRSRRRTARTSRKRSARR